MKERNGKGPAACSYRRGICLAAFTLAILSAIPSCKSGSADELEDLPTYAQLEPAGQAEAKSSGAPVTTPTAETAAPQSPAATQAGLTTSPTATDADTQDSAVPADAAGQQNGTDAQEASNALSIPEDEVYSVENAKAGYILLASGEIVAPSYMAYCGVKGMEPIGIICFRDTERKMVISMDAFYPHEDLYGPGTWQKNKDLSILSLKPAGPTSGSYKFSYDPTVSKRCSDGNQQIIRGLIERGTENANLFMDYIAPYGTRVSCSGRNLDWQAPTLYEGLIILYNATTTKDTIQSLIKFFDRIGDDRARILEKSDDLVYFKEYVLTSSTGQTGDQKKPEYGFWAFRSMEKLGEQPNDSRFKEMKDMNGKNTFSYRYFCGNLDTGAGVYVEVVLVNPDSDGFRSFPVAYLN